jgi:hypothetical protein
MNDQHSDTLNTSARAVLTRIAGDAERDIDEGRIKLEGEAADREIARLAEAKHARALLESTIRVFDGPVIDVSDALAEYHAKYVAAERARIEADMPFHLERIAHALSCACTFARREGDVYSALTCGQYLGEAMGWISKIYSCPQFYDRARELRRVVDDWCREQLGAHERQTRAEVREQAHSEGYAEGLKSGRRVVRKRAKKAAAGEPVRCLQCATPLALTPELHATLYPAGTLCARCGV